jgi:hypothetical protein
MPLAPGHHVEDGVEGIPSSQKCPTFKSEAMELEEQLRNHEGNHEHRHLPLEKLAGRNAAKQTKHETNPLEK